MHRHPSRNFRIIGVLFWAFPWLLWQASGHIIGFFVGVALAIMLTWMLYSLFNQENSMTSDALLLPHQAAALHLKGQEENRKETEPYQKGYPAETEPYRREQPPYQVGELQPQYEEMQVLYLQEISPLEQS